MPPVLFHFSDRAGLKMFRPRPVAVPARRPPGQDWLNGPLVWAIAPAVAPLYLFPRDCPRVLIWRRPDSPEADARRWMPDPDAPMAAFVEAAWLDRLRSTALHRYSLPSATFRDLEDAGMHVSREAVPVLAEARIADLPAALADRGVTLTALPSLAPLRPAWASSLHVSGLRLRNAAGWDAAPADA